MSDLRVLVVTTDNKTEQRQKDADTAIVGSGVKTAAGDLTITAFSDNIALASSTTVAAAKNFSIAAAATGNFDWSTSSGTFKTGTGAVALNGTTTLASSKDFTAAGGTSKLDYTAASGIFTSPTGANTLQGNVTVSSGKSLSSAGGVSNFDWGSSTGTFATSSGANTLGGDTTLASGKNLFITTTGRFDTTTGAPLNIGTTTATDLNLGRTGQLTTVKGNFQVDGTSTLVGGTTFNANVTFEGNTTFGNAATDLVTFVARVADDIHFLKEVNHVIDVDASTTAAASGGNLTITAASAGTGTAATPGGTGGTLPLTAGAGGIASAGTGAGGAGGNCSLKAGAGGAAAAGTGAGGAGGTLITASGFGGAGSATAAPGAGGDYTLTAGSAGTVGGFGGGANGGNVAVNAGALSGTGTDGTISIGVTTGSAVTISKSGVTTTVAGNFAVTGTTSLNGVVNLGDAAADTIAFKGQVGPSGFTDITFVKELDHTVSVDTTTTATVAGGALTFSTATGGAASGASAGGAGGLLSAFAANGGAAAGGAGSAGDGGDIFVNSGKGGAGTATGIAGAGGDVTITANNAGFDGGAGGAAGGGVTITTGNGSGASNGGALGLDTGSGANPGAITVAAITATSVTIGQAGGATTTTIQGGLTQNTGVFSLTGNATSSLSTSAGALTLDGFTGISLRKGATEHLAIGAATVQVKSATFSASAGAFIDLHNDGRWKINGSAVTATVTATALDVITAGAASNADAYHTHSAGTASQLTITGLTTTGLADGDFGYISANNTLTKTDAASMASSRMFGSNEGAVGSMTVNGTIENAKFIAGLTLLAGDPVFLAKTAGKLTNDVSAFVAGDVVAEVGIVKDQANYAGLSTSEVLIQVKKPLQL